MEENLFGKMVKELRLSKKMTQQEFGNIVNITATGISYWESGKAIPSIDIINKLSIYFGVSVDYLMGKDNIDEFDKWTILLRKTENVDEKERDKMFNIIESTIDIFLSSQDHDHK